MLRRLLVAVSGIALAGLIQSVAWAQLYGANAQLTLVPSVNGEAIYYYIVNVDNVGLRASTEASLEFGEPRIFRLDAITKRWDQSYYNSRTDTCLVYPGSPVLMQAHPQDLGIYQVSEGEMEAEQIFYGWAYIGFDPGTGYMTGLDAQWLPEILYGYTD